MSGTEEPRRPRNMQGLLNFCTQITVREDAPNVPSASAMDPERRAFLQDVMSSLSTNYAKHTARHLKNLASSEDIDDPNADTEMEESALEDLVEIVQDVDNATDLMKMDGIPVLLLCINSVHHSVAELSCEVLGVVCQNNPACQTAVLNTVALNTLLLLLDSDTALRVRAKALYAVSCLVRGHSSAMEAFDKLDGFSYLMRVMQTSSDKLFVKAIFLIAALLEEYKPSTAQLLSMGYTELLVNYLCAGDLNGQTTCPGSSTTSDSECSEARQSANAANSSREHCTSALLKLCSVAKEARRACARNEALMDQLATRLADINNVEEHQEETDYITALLKLLKKQNRLPDDTEESTCR